MNRSWVIWLVAAFCALIVMIAMGVMSVRVLDTESKRIEADRRADEMERVRLALWRLESGATAVLVAENQRLPEEYRSYYTPTSLWSVDDGKVDPGELKQASPLLGVPGDPVLLHFEIDEQGYLASPEVPEGKDRELALRSGLSEQWFSIGEERLEKLRQLLGVDFAEMEQKRESQRKSNTVSQFNINILENIVRNNTESVKESSVTSPAVDAITSVSPKKSDKVEKEKVVRGKSKLSQYTDQGKRLALKEDAIRRQSISNAAVALEKQEFSRKRQEPRSDDLPKDAKTTDLVGEVNDFGKDTDSPGYDRQRTAQVSSMSLPFQSVWIEDQLLLIREVYIGQKKKLQGVWLDHEKLKSSLLDTVSDILPNASLLPISRFSFAVDANGGALMKALPLDENPMSLVSFPLLLEPGGLISTKAYDRVAFKPLVGAWLATLLGLLAVAGLLAGVMKMSARRAAFVSAVTHELRTPLTTFKLYSEMLAEGMVANEDTRKEYLGTLTKEADRLGHLVENVLAYSKIEKGSARTQLREETLGAHIEAMKARLQGRVEEEGAVFFVQMNEDVSSKMLKVDFTALEQIIFNLIDNACKYGCDADQPEVMLSVSADSSAVFFRVTDRGKGISKSEQKKLFRPFHKSAEDAAHSKPGVGLGLALCRQLSKALGGSLSIEKAGERGACFCLKLPFL